MMEPAAEELEQRRQEQRPIANRPSEGGADLVLLEQRQAAILSRIAGLLFGTFDSSKCKSIRPPDAQEHAADGGGGEEEGASREEKSRGTELREDDSSSSVLREKVLQNRTDADSSPAQCEGVLRDDGRNVDVETRLAGILREGGADFRFRRVPSDYYGRSFEERRDLLGAASVDHLCKSIVMVNTQAHESVTDCTDRNNSKYYVIVVQYTARLNAEKVKHFVYSLNNGKIPKKRFNLRLAPEDESNELTGFAHNAVTPFGMLTNIPVILSDAIVKLEPEFFWLGGGEVDLKLGIRTDHFVKIVKPFVVDCVY